MGVCHWHLSGHPGGENNSHFSEQCPTHGDPQCTTKNDHNLLSRPPRPLQPTRLQCTPPKWAASRQSYLWSHGAYIENLTKVSPWLGGLGIGGCWLGILREGRGLWGPLSEGRHTEYVLGVRPEPENFRGAPHRPDTAREGEIFLAPLTRVSVSSPWGPT